VAALLEPGGTFAGFAVQVRLADPDVAAAVSAARTPFLSSDQIPSPDGTPPEREMQWPGTELLRSECFGDIRQLEFERRPVMSAADYIGYLSTVSAYLELPAPVREEAFGRILEALPDRVDIATETVMHLARRTA
jgi:hypothetical protein